MRVSVIALAVLAAFAAVAAAATRRARAASLRAVDSAAVTSVAEPAYKTWINNVAGDGKATWKDLVFAQCGFQKGPVRGTSSGKLVGAGLWHTSYLRLTCVAGTSSIEWREHASGNLGVTATGVVTMPAATAKAADKDAWQCELPRVAAKGAAVFPAIYDESGVEQFARNSVNVKCASGWNQHAGCLCIKVAVENAMRPFLRLHADGPCTVSAASGKGKKAKAVRKTLTKDELEQLLVDELNECKAGGAASHKSSLGLLPQTGESFHSQGSLGNVVRDKANSQASAGNQGSVKSSSSSKSDNILIGKSGKIPACIEHPGDDESAALADMKAQLELLGWPASELTAEALKTCYSTATHRYSVSPFIKVHCTEALTWPRRTGKQAIALPVLFPASKGPRGRPLLSETKGELGAHMESLQKKTGSLIVNPHGDGNCFFASLVLAQLPPSAKASKKKQPLAQDTVTADEVETAANRLRKSLVDFMRSLAKQPCPRSVFMTGAMAALIDEHVSDATSPDEFLSYLGTPRVFADESAIMPAAVLLDACITVWDFPEPACSNANDPKFIALLCEAHIRRINIDAAIAVYGQRNTCDLLRRHMDPKQYLSSLPTEEAYGYITDLISGNHIKNYDEVQDTKYASSRKFGPLDAAGNMACSTEITLVRDENHYSLLQKAAKK